jgi:tetratricopeptide (TPR) repeat protein
LRYLIVGILAGGVFYFLRVHVHSLGDGYLRIGQIESGIRYLHTEPLDFWLHGLLYDFLGVFGDVSGEAVYQIFSIGIGIAFVLIVYGLDLKDGITAGSPAGLKWLILCLGGVQLFFGYVESYALFYSAMLVYTLLAFRYMATGRGFTGASAAFAVGLASHLTGFFFLPTYLYLSYVAYKDKKMSGQFSRTISIGIIIVLVVGLIISELVVRSRHAQYLAGPGDYFLPVISGEYAILSGHHLLDILNQFLLIIPIPLGLIVSLVMLRKVNPHPRLRVFGIILSLCAGVFLLMINPSLGFARDWDLFATSAALIGCIVLVFYFRKAAPGRPAGVTLSAALAAVFVSTWIFTNASPGRQLQRAEDLLSLSDKGRGYCTELLAHYYRYEADNKQKVVDLLGGITGPARNARVLRIMAVTQYEMKRYADALRTAREGLAQDSTVAETNYVAGMSLTELGFADSATSYLEVAQHNDSRNYTFTRSLAKNYYSIGRIETAIEGYKYAISLEPKKPTGYFDVAAIYLENRLYDSAFYYAQTGLKVAPDFAAGYRIMETIKAAARESLKKP